MDFAYFLIVLVAIAINVAFAMYAGGIAEQKGYSKGNWIAVCIIFGIVGYTLIAALPDLELRATLENIEKKLAKDKNDNYLPRNSSNSNSNSIKVKVTIPEHLTDVYEQLDWHGQDLDALLATTKLSTAQLIGQLMELELLGVISEQGGRYLRL